MASYLVAAALLPSIANAAVSWQFTDTPRQCENLNLTASGGTPPYNLLMVPSGPSTISNEVRTLQQITFNDSSSLSFKLRYPANESFVAVVSDSTTFGNGGTTTPVTVLNSGDTSCYDASKSVSGPWVFSAKPNSLTTCQPTRFYWQQPLVNGTVTFKGIIPGGESFNIPVSQTSTDSDGTGFNWSPNIPAQTIMYIVAGDDRGPVGGSALFTVSQGTDTSCINSNSPSSTAGSPAGGSYPTNSSGAGVGGGSPGGSGGGGGGSSTNVGAIVGGVVGGVGGIIVAIFLAWFLLVRRRRRTAAYNKERPVNILQDDDDDDRGRHAQLPQYYEPEPFLAPEPLMDDRESVSEGGSRGRPATPAGLTDITSSSRKTAMPRLRPVNIVQHEDAGPSGAPESQEPETVELPPAYTHIRTGNTPTIEDAPAPAAIAPTAESRA